MSEEKSPYSFGNDDIEPMPVMGVGGMNVKRKMHVRIVWDDDLVKRLSDLWEMNLTASQIGESIGLTRNAVLGKARRLNLKNRKNGSHGTPFNVFEKRNKKKYDELIGKGK